MRARVRVWLCVRTRVQKEFWRVQDLQSNCISYRAIHSVMGWLRLVGSLKLWVSFAEYRLFYRALLQKRPIILRSLLIEATHIEHPFFFCLAYVCHASFWRANREQDRKRMDCCIGPVCLIHACKERARQKENGLLYRYRTYRVFYSLSVLLSLCTRKWGMARIWMSHITHMNEARHTYQWVTAHIWMRHVTHVNEARHIYEWVTRHTWMSHVTWCKNIWIQTQVFVVKCKALMIPHELYLVWNVYKMRIAIRAIQESNVRYWVATVSRIDKMIGLFCRIASLL